jgi:autotransporter-associated beta strand protein
VSQNGIYSLEVCVSHRSTVFRLCCSVLLLFPACLWAATATWDQNTGGSWNVNGNWDPNTGFPNGATDNAVFATNGSMNADQIIDTQGQIDVGTLTFNNNTFVLFLSNTVNNSPLRINSGLTNISVGGSGNIQVDNVHFQFMNTTNIFAGDGGGILNINRSFLGTGGQVFRKDGSFVLNFAVNAGFTNTDVFILDKGKLKLGNNGSLGALSNLIVNGGTITTLPGGTLIITNMLTVNGNYTVNSTGGSTILTNSGPLILGSTTHQISIGSNFTNLWTGIASGAAGLSKAGTGTLFLSDNNTFTGNVTNTAGTMVVNSANALGVLGAGHVISVTGGTLLYNVGFTNTAAVELSGGQIQEVDQNVSLGALSLTASSSIQLNSGGSAGTLTFASGTNTSGAVAVLTIYGWNYNSVTDSGSDDLIFFTDPTMETASFLNKITFFGLGAGARLLSTGELVPITPEPGTFLSAMLLCGLCFRRFKDFLHKKTS